MDNIRYSAVVLDEKSKQRLIEKLKNEIPEGFEIIAHHMTINLGEIDPEFKQYLGFSPIGLNVNDIAIDDKVMAVGVSGFGSKNAKPHITVAVNRANGGKPMMSNRLTNWKPLKRPFIVSGKVMEVR